MFVIDGLEENIEYTTGNCFIWNKTGSCTGNEQIEKKMGFDVMGI